MVIVNCQWSIVNSQIVIGGNVYGGGNAGKTGGSTSVTVHAGDINAVFGGARMANVEGSAFVHIDGEHASNYIVVNKVYGGNDIAGTIGKTDEGEPSKSKVLPTELTQKTENGIDNTWDAFVRISTKTVTTGTGDDAVTTEAADAKEVYIGQLFGGGNGDYYYRNAGDAHEIYASAQAYNNHEDPIATNTTGFILPDLGKTYLEILGGSIVYAYGGGNNATITKGTVIALKNPSKVVSSIIDASNPNAGTGGELLTNARFEDKMDINTTFSYPNSDAFQIGRLFGGNNKAAMAIRPRWKLQEGKVRNLYGGGNEGSMTSPEGLLLQIDGAGMVVDNVYGGCRKADVKPLDEDGQLLPYYQIKLPAADNPNNIPDGYASRVRVTAGHVTNVYGGNDISGNIFGGNTVGIRTHIYGDVYGGGNGSYAYTDNVKLKDDPHWRDFYYNPDEVLTAAGVSGVPEKLKSVTALNLIRPNSEKVSILVRGDDAEHPAILDGGLYVGGNSASLRENLVGSSSGDKTHIKIGSYVIIDSVFLGNNGANMIKYNEADAEGRGEGVLRTLRRTDIASNGSRFNSMDLTDPEVFAIYMEGCAMKEKSAVVFENRKSGDAADYVAYSTQFGSFYCGGNVGSMITEGMTTINFNYPVIIFDKLVGGSNNAVVLASAYNARYEGGVLGNPDAKGNKITMNLSGLAIQPKRWKDENNKSLATDLVWNVVDKDGLKVNPEDIPAPSGDKKAVAADLERRLVGGNIYGGCCTSGVVNGNVIINVNATLMDRDMLFDDVEAAGEGLYGGDVLNMATREYTINERRSGVIYDEQGMDVLGSALCLFGGGKGRETEIWGSTTVNLNKGFVFQVFGGSEEGIIGKAVATGGTYTFKGKSFAQNDNYSCTINLRSPSDADAEAEFIYGGGFLGPVCGNTILNLGKGKVFNTFAGACNADILGHTETYMGRQIKDDGTFGEGFPEIEDYIYGGNDLGGRILGKADFTTRVRGEVATMIHSADASKNVSAYIEYQQGHAKGIFGGCYGTYDYTDPEYKAFFYTTGSDGQTSANLGTARPGYTKPRMGKAFVNFRPTYSDALLTNKKNAVSEIYGSGQGYPGDADRDIMQQSSYILIDIPQAMTNYADAGLQVWGAGAWSGLGMATYVAPVANDGSTPNTTLDNASAIIDLTRGQLNAVYGGSYREGFTRRSVVNVKAGSTVKLNKLFGGAYGVSNSQICDVYEANVNYYSEAARVYAIYGGNNSARRTLYGRVNIGVPVWGNKESNWMGTVYGAGYGEGTWSQYTEVNLFSGSQVYEVFGGGENGRVANVVTTKRMSELEYNDDTYSGLKIADEYVGGSKYEENGLNNPLATARHDGKKYNTNVLIHKGALVGLHLEAVEGYSGPAGYTYKGGYAFGGGLGNKTLYRSGDVSGTTYIALLGGRVLKDIYAAGSVGAVLDYYGTDKNGVKLKDDSGNDFVASTNAYIAGGTCRNVYGGGYMGSVGRHMKKSGDIYVEADIKEVAGTDYTDSPDIDGVANVTIGIREDQDDADLIAAMTLVKGSPATKSEYGFYNGIPTIERNAYGGGEGETAKGGKGGAVFGTTNITLNNGRIGYVYLNGDFVEKLNDETWTQGDSLNRLVDYGCLFGGGYSDKSNVDFTNVVMYGGILRGSLYGGAEVAAIGRGSTKESGVANSVREFEAIYKAGKTRVVLYNGLVMRNVFGGGKGYNNLGFGGSNEFYTDGYVFGQTEVYIHGGVVGTEATLAEGKGNVFGAGDVGYVYSKGYSNANSRTTSTGSPDHYFYYYNDGTGDKLIEDCRVVVAPYLQVKPGYTITYNGKTYNAYDYVPTDFLNTLPKKNPTTKKFDGDWLKLYTGANSGVSNATEDTEERGVLIRNGVFAGGNVSSNDDTHYANATTVFGNTTATLYDVYHRDFITVGTEHTGGLYGGGNLSVVDGYRELNITNYGTDYYGLDQQITLEEYRNLSNRERAYFQLQYYCHSAMTFGDVHYDEGKILKEDEYLKLLEQYPAASSHFTPYGFCSIYAGRLLNTIQRADFCGVYGSRMVLQGAKDRVADVAEDIDYTINRVGELSLNQKHSVRTSANGYSDNLDTGDDATHGNYFGIYSVVNYMGNLTSDVPFGHEYVNGSGVTESDKTYYSYKAANPTSSTRNKGMSVNQVALASGVFLELTTENSTADQKDYGYVTGVIELDLINVRRDEVGGGFVYAKNEHRVPMYYPNKNNVILSEYNHTLIVNGTELRNEARTYKRYYYTDDNLPTGAEAEGANVISGDDAHVFQSMAWQTSGNFIHPSRRIVDDCYPINNAYTLNVDPYSEAHYWYVKGDVYIYDQKVSAYTGSANAYSKAVHLPLTITAASHGRLQLLNVKPNLYAYYAPTNTTGTEKKKIGTFQEDGQVVDKVWVNNQADSYELNDVITWWDWHQLSATERAYFVTNTYANCITVTIDGTEYEPGTYVMNDADFVTFKGSTHTLVNAAGEDTTVDFVFRSSNNLSHESGYVLTFDMDTPKKWTDYYTKTVSSPAEIITKATYGALATSAQDEYREGPTFTPVISGVYGQRQYIVGDIVTKETVDNNAPVSTADDATMEVAYVATERVTYTYNGQSKTLNAGTAIPKTEYLAIGSTAQASFDVAYTCTSTLKLAGESYLVYGDLKTQNQINDLKDTYASVKDNEGNITGYTSLASDINAAMTPAYICSKAGGYGGQLFETGHNYSALSAWCGLPKSDRIDSEGDDNFTFNYDALDLLNDSEYLALGGIESPTHTRTVDAFHSPYTDQVPVEYSAVFNEADHTEVEFNDGTTVSTYVKGESRLTNEQFENVRNDQRHYTHVTVNAGGEDIYIAKENFIYNGVPYGKGQVIDDEVALITTNQSHVESVHFDNSDVLHAIEVYYCYEDYGNVTKGTKIDKTAFSNLTNHQKYFIIQGQEPTETTTLYVSRESDIYDLMKKKVITVVYQYTYYEDEDDGSVKLTNELHVINIHLELESGAPQIGQLNPPAMVLPGDAVGLKAPEVKPGLYEILNNGWELFGNEDDAEHHRNGVSFTNNLTPVYWYQHQKAYVAFYSRTYLGKTYSNPVPLSVANYHDLDAVMKDKEHHMYVDRSDVSRASKIYIDDRDCLSDATKSELDLLKDFFDLSVLSASDVERDVNGLITTEGKHKGHALLNSHVSAANHLEFFLRSDVSPKAYTTWTPIGTTGQPCFSGTLHGDGYTVSGLDHSLFDKLCGDVYNLGVTGSFTGAGIAETGEGYIENCWISTSAVSGFAADTNPVFGRPTRDGGGIQVENCYYPESNAYLTKDYGHGMARQMPDKAFFNGTVAYNLNGFYLKKRYYDHTQSALGSSAIEYKYLPAATDGSLPTNMSTAKYPATYALYRPDIQVGEGETVPYMGYVENRFYDGDYRYAGGYIPDGLNLRMRTVTTTVGTGNQATERTDTYFVPIWPDDYIFFGQALTYGHVGTREHQDNPSVIRKSSDRIVSTADGNRVYRAPAYFRSKQIDVAHFNPYAVFAQTKNDDVNVIAYKDMTAIDFSGGNSNYQYGLVTGQFFPPLLDDDGLTNFLNVDLTRNLLVYTAGTTTSAQKTESVVSSYLHDQPYVEDNATYHTVSSYAAYEQDIRGHRVHKTDNGDYVAQNDHFLVDKQDFNCPIAYSFAAGTRMWHQRLPERFVGSKLNNGSFADSNAGWEGVSLPFKADIVTTNVKGEITHFYSGSQESANDTHTKIGHEYWLRQFKAGGSVSANDANVYEAAFGYPDASSADGDKEYTNTFLWDYYYSLNERNDLNNDDYQEGDANGSYYSQTRTFDDYPRLDAAIPYIIGFPGERYYEFDLSGKFKAETTASPNPEQLGVQTITFASAEGASIGVSDDETVLSTSPAQFDGYTFMPTYMNTTLVAGSNAFTLNNDGSSYDKVSTSEASAILPFRPYFVVASGNNARHHTRSIVFGGVPSQLKGEDGHGDADDEDTGSLRIYAKRHKIIVQSSLPEATTVRIIAANGITIDTFTIEPGETVSTTVGAKGVYIVNHKKLVVR